MESRVNLVDTVKDGRFPFVRTTEQRCCLEYGHRGVLVDWEWSPTVRFEDARDTVVLHQGMVQHRSTQNEGMSLATDRRADPQTGNETRRMLCEISKRGRGLLDIHRSRGDQVNRREDLCL